MVDVSTSGLDRSKDLKNTERTHDCGYKAAALTAILHFCTTVSYMTAAFCDRVLQLRLKTAFTDTGMDFSVFGNIGWSSNGVILFVCSWKGISDVHSQYHDAKQNKSKQKLAQELHHHRLKNNRKYERTRQGWTLKKALEPIRTLSPLASTTMLVSGFHHGILSSCFFGSVVPGMIDQRSRMVEGMTSKDGLDDGFFG